MDRKSRRDEESDEDFEESEEESSLGSEEDSEEEDSEEESEEESDEDLEGDESDQDFEEGDESEEEEIVAPKRTNVQKIAPKPSVSQTREEVSTSTTSPAKISSEESDEYIQKLSSMNLWGKIPIISVKYDFAMTNAVD